jgi:tRNA threonylcarbamoyladenosine biosynthesis protein TsaB
VAVTRGPDRLAHVAYDGGTFHAERLFLAIDAALRAAGAQRGDLAALACDIGPGSFTGVRVGVASCQGVALGLGLPVFGVGSLEAMARAARDDGAGDVPILAVLDARKEEVFAAVLDPGGLAVWGPEHLGRERAHELKERAEQLGATIVGAMAAELGLQRVRRGAALDLPDALAVAQLASFQLTERGAAAGDPARLEPRYVRAPDAKTLAEQGK